MDSSFQNFLDHYLNTWSSSSLTGLSEIISKNYKGREITGGKIVDFGYEESINGWAQGFNFVKENNAQWVLNTKFIIPLRDDEYLVIISATMAIKGNSLETSNLFFQTFKKNSNDWKLVRSYIEAGIPNVNLNKVSIN